MVLRLDPIAIVILSILMGWGWTELTTEPICEKQIERNGEQYIIPIKCATIPN
ncbi:hypothetical protein G6Z94_11790 [Vibrio aestuarianus]|uniref:hypothetical protein n=1 Tax=Vibrio aestuarianus TaxID=28171 RepID=UPI001592D1F3|nr:hypothetical protein [Vibrio aestuarianus]NGZ18021.1 hypothetical protein [Vibrio aestuarianus]